MKIREMLQCELARREFWEYCKLLHKDFYREDREFLKELCYKLQDFYYNDDEFMIVNEPPRHGKSFTATNFVEWVLGQNPLERIMSASYSHDLSKNFSKKVRGTISTEKIGENIVYSDIFQETKLKFGSSEAMKWQTDKSNQINYLATSPSGSATGFGCTLMVIDDLVKNAYEANNESILEAQYEWFVNTMLSRREGKKKVLIIMTRWNSKDLAGKILEYVEENNISYSHINFKAEQEDGTMLCPSIFDKKASDRAKQLMGEDIYEANYNQTPIDMKGCLYSNLQTYSELPTVLEVCNYTDTADEGTDYLCSINYAICSDDKAYILDVIYTQDAMEITEPLVAGMLTKDDVNYAVIESNNGGKGFARNVERICRENNNNHTMFKRFTQTKNKVSRILTGATGVMQNVVFPADWKSMYPKFYKDVTQFQRLGKNKHDDCVDVLTGIYEQLRKRTNSGW
ncbi:MAG: phage terminase large subunit [Clostridiales bacterium]|uniref:phage terminase large subunit n=1 Tax=Terrisporobacter sp. TaxID=1965305 RepID=UPI002A515896|nr:phage terminase large subunit [Terrisporobacter sp.]MDD7755804.1 phage terminase large subunit [Clostridiales bacterium]MDY4136796.1 phage terminase large subunit [Terrisporobacter sp.]